jgi:hypothetical protein
MEEIMNLKRKKTKYVLLMLISIMILMIISCSSESQILANQKDERFTRSDNVLYLTIEHSFETDNIKLFTQSYSEYGVEIIASYCNIVYLNMYRYLTMITYDPDLINEDALISLFTEDRNIGWPGRTPCWTENGIVTVNLLKGNSDAEINNFINAYSEFDVELLYKDRLSNRIKIHFNCDKVNYLSFLNTLEQDNRIQDISITRHVPGWTQGELLAVLNINENTDDYISTYLENFITDYQEQIQKCIILLNGSDILIVKLTFDYHLIDEFEILELIQNDDRVKIANFNSYSYFY